MYNLLWEIADYVYSTSFLCNYFFDLASEFLQFRAIVKLYGFQAGSQGKVLLERRWAQLSREGPENTGGLAGGVYLVDAPVVLSAEGHCARIECCSSLVAYERRWIGRAEVHIV